MAKTQEELRKLKEEYEKLSLELSNLSEEELNKVIGGDKETMQDSKYERCSIYVSAKHDRCYLSKRMQEAIESQYSCSVCPKR